MRRAPPALGLLLALFAVGCRGAPPAPVDAAMADLAQPGDLSAGELGAPVFAELAFAGCPKVVMVEGRLRCTGPAPLELTLVSIVPPGIESWTWTLAGAAPPTSKSPAPSVRYVAPGTYAVKLVASGPSGTAPAEGEVVVTPAGLAAPCNDDIQCAPLACLCAMPPDGGAGCGGLSGFCTRSCAGASCGVGEVCADLSRSAAHDAQVGALPWRHPICLPACVATADCRPGFVCRALPALPAPGIAGGPFTWRRGCFSGLLGDVGASCADAEGKPAPTTCITGECAVLGARDLCTLGCAKDPCPAEAACATFTGDAAHPICLARCDQAHPCADPLLACQSQNSEGALGFVLPPVDKSASVCAPRRCMKPADCVPAGMCGGGGDGGVMGFCTL
ncbi:MAG: hypothetical protein EXR72_20575 [Myxococcales bacterium]|nr:hypothetical protein [Myxococcales bacterium]